MLYSKTTDFKDLCAELHVASGEVLADVLLEKKAFTIQKVSNLC